MMARATKRAMTMGTKRAMAMATKRAMAAASVASVVAAVSVLPVGVAQAAGRAERGRDALEDRTGWGPGINWWNSLVSRGMIRHDMAARIGTTCGEIDSSCN